MFDIALGSIALAVGGPYDGESVPMPEATYDGAKWFFPLGDELHWYRLRIADESLRLHYIESTLRPGTKVDEPF